MNLAVEVSTETLVPTTKIHGIISHKTVKYFNFVPLIRFKTPEIQVLPQRKITHITVTAAHDSITHLLSFERKKTLIPKVSESTHHKHWTHSRKTDNETSDNTNPYLGSTHHMSIICFAVYCCCISKRRTFHWLQHVYGLYHHHQLRVKRTLGFRQIIFVSVIFLLNNFLELSRHTYWTLTVISSWFKI